MKEAPGARDYDLWLLAILAAICTIGVVEIYSATHGSALAGMHMKQIRWIAVGVVLMFVLSRLDYHAIMDQAPWLYIAGLVALIAVLAVGHTRFGAKRWIPVLGEFLQVSELVKLIIIIVLARFFAEVRTDELSLQDLIKAVLLVGLPLVLILKQPDLGTALVLMPMLIVGAFLAGLQWKHAAVIVVLGILMLPVGWHFMKPYQKERVTSFLHPEEDAKGSGYQVLQSKIAVSPRVREARVVSGGRVLATAARINWDIFQSGIPTLLCRPGRKNRDSKECWLPSGCTWRCCCV